MTARMLNEAQHRSLDRIADKDEYAIVTGWSASAHAPIVERPLLGDVVVVGVSGRTARFTE